MSLYLRSDAHEWLSPTKEAALWEFVDPILTRIVEPFAGRDPNKVLPRIAFRINTFFAHHCPDVLEAHVELDVYEKAWLRIDLDIPKLSEEAFYEQVLGKLKVLSV